MSRHAWTSLLLLRTLASAGAVLLAHDQAPTRTTSTATITPAPSLPSPRLEARDGGAVTYDPSFEGFTSAFGSWSPLYCSPGSTYKTLGSTLAACCPTGAGANCNPVTHCLGSKAFLQNGDDDTCSGGGCDTAYISASMSETAPRVMLGCWDAMWLMRPTDQAVLGSISSGMSGQPTAAASTAAATTTDGSASSSTASGKKGTAKPTPNSSASGPSVGIIAAGVAGGLLLLAVIAGLAVYIVILKKRGGPAGKPGPTELQQRVPAGPAGADNTAFKAELPTKEGWAYELPPDTVGGPLPGSSPAAPSAHQQQLQQFGGWGGQHTPVSPFQASELPTPVGPHGGVFNRVSSYRELPG